jgi:hypothetical protein
MRFETKGLTREQALDAARAALLVTGKPHVVYQLRNGRWKWARAGWFRSLLNCALSPAQWMEVPPHA